MNNNICYIWNHSTNIQTFKSKVFKHYHQQALFVHAFFLTVYLNVLNVMMEYLVIYKHHQIQQQLHQQIHHEILWMLLNVLMIYLVVYHYHQYQQQTHQQIHDEILLNLLTHQQTQHQIKS